MKIRPILFSTPMVQAILAGSKTVTRRGHGVRVWTDCCPYGQRGDRLWVRETWCRYYASPKAGKFVYRADGELSAREKERDCIEPKWKPSIFMPRVAARIILYVESVTIERLQAITEAEAKAEGVKLGEDLVYSARSLFSHLWDKLNAKRGYGWAKNPWVWRISFQRIA
jgi:hypothetical protein